MYNTTNTTEYSTRHTATHTNTAPYIAYTACCMPVRDSFLSARDSFLMADDVASFLQQHGLDPFAEAFAALGYDSVALLRALESEELDTLINDAGMKSGHAAKLRRGLAGATAPAAAAAAQSAPSIGGEGAAGPADAVPAAPPPATAKAGAPPPQAERGRAAGPLHIWSVAAARRYDWPVSTAAALYRSSRRSGPCRRRARGGQSQTAAGARVGPCCMEMYARIQRITIQEIIQP